jgi:hypothetical protein
VLKIEQ